MDMKSSSIFAEPWAQPYLLEGAFGLEKEHVRVDEAGNLALTPHPRAFGDKLANPYITVDFSESQLEMITPPQRSMGEALGFLETIHDVVVENLTDELLWPQSMPPALPEDGSKIPLAVFDDEHRALTEYREFLAQTYGRRKQLISGIHVNISVSDQLLRGMQKRLAMNDLTFSEFKSWAYMRALRNMMRYRWMMVVMLGNAPAAHQSYASMCCDMPETGGDARGSEHSVSIRASMCGYRNNEEFILDYSSQSGLNCSVRSLVDQGKLIHEKELYSPIRLKCDHKTGELTHLELRILDLDPSVKVGIRPQSLHLLHLFMLWAMGQDETREFDADEQMMAVQNQYRAACCGFHSELLDNHGVPFADGAKDFVVDFLSELESLIVDDGELAGEYRSSLADLHAQLAGGQISPLELTKRQIREHGFVASNLQRAKDFRAQSLAQGFNFYAYQDMELSTQLMMREAVLRGVKFELIDRAENFVKFEKAGHVEYVQQATKTSHDTYSSVLMMENKVVTKKVLADAGIRVPLGGDYDDVARAKVDFAIYQGEAIVVKPKSTNFGLGISILKENDSRQNYEQALEMAFAEDKSVLVEPFISGREFRFFLINGKVEGILHRVPANVLGDGESTISQLIEEKNLDPLRGVGYRTPLEKIAAGPAEEMFLQAQGLGFHCVPAAGKKVYLRENSNISTGGDSIDFTDDIHSSYFEIAERAAAAMGVNITGLDMMIDDINEPASETNYAIIEMNFNPAIHIHCHPYQGKNRQLNVKMMDFLGY